MFEKKNVFLHLKIILSRNNEKYKQKSLREDHYDIEDIVNAKAIEGVENKNRSKELQDFKQKYGALPRNYVEEIRTGFRSGDGLTQSLPRFV